jgi:hypothetical protein
MGMVFKANLRHSGFLPIMTQHNQRKQFLTRIVESIATRRALMQHPAHRVNFDYTGKDFDFSCAPMIRGYKHDYDAEKIQHIIQNSDKGLIIEDANGVKRPLERSIDVHDGSNVIDIELNEEGLNEN